MILILLFVFILALAIFGCIASDNDWIKNYDLDNAIGIGSIIIIMVSNTAILISLLIIWISHSGVDVDIQRGKFERDGLLKKIEFIDSDYEDISKREVIDDVVAWNSKVYSYKYWSANPWTNWFYDKDYVDSLEYIEIFK